MIVGTIICEVGTIMCDIGIIDVRESHIGPVMGPVLVLVKILCFVVSFCQYW